MKHWLYQAAFFRFLLVFRNFQGVLVSHVVCHLLRQIGVIQASSLRRHFLFSTRAIVGHLLISKCAVLYQRYLILTFTLLAPTLPASKIADNNKDSLCTVLCDQVSARNNHGMRRFLKDASLAARLGDCSMDHHENIATCQFVLLWCSVATGGCDCCIVIHCTPLP